MSTYRFSFELSNRRGKGESPGLSVGDPNAARTGYVTLAAGDNQYLAPTILPYVFEQIQAAECIYTAGVDVALQGARFRTWRGLNGWYIDLPGAGGDFYNNAVNDPTILDRDVNGDRKSVLNVSGDAATALSNLTGPGAVAFKVDVSRTVYGGSSTNAIPNVQQSSSIVFDLYADDALDNLPNLDTLAARTLKNLQGQGDGLLVLAESGNNKITVPQVCAAFGFGRPIFVTADQGNGFGQIPTDQTLWTPATFAPHPRVFIRPSNTHGWQLRHLFPSPVGSPTVLTEDDDLTPVLATRRPTHSAWRILLEGNLLDVIIAHPATGDYRRPRDIWRAVWAPAIAANTPVKVYNWFLAGVAPNYIRSFYTKGLLTGLQYLDMAYCLDLYDADGGDPLIQFPIG